MDYVVDIESSLFYPNQERFFKAVSYVLKEDGLFLFSDCRNASQFDNLERKLKKCFDIEVKEDITSRITAALKIDTPRMKDLIEKNFPLGT